MPPACCFLPIGPLGNAAHAPMAAGADWVNVAPNWITAIATVGLLIGAIVTARYAIKAFGKQSEQLKDQRDINELQAKDLEASLEERKRLREVAERQQANDVGFAWWPASHVLIINSPAQPPSSTPRHPEAVAHVDTSGSAVLVVDNASRHRILDVKCRIEPAAGFGMTLTAERIGQLTDVGSSAHRGMMNNPAEGSTVPLIRVGSRYGFLFRFDLEHNPDARLAARFTDDAGLHWQLDHDLHLEKLPDRTDW